jgi:hypothetical protein
MMVKKSKHRASTRTRQPHDPPPGDEDVEEEGPGYEEADEGGTETEAAVEQPEAEASAVVAKASHTHDGSTGHPAMVLPASQVPQTHTQATLSNPSSPMSEVIRKLLWVAQSG